MLKRRDACPAFICCSVQERIWRPRRVISLRRWAEQILSHCASFFKWKTAISRKNKPYRQLIYFFPLCPFFCCQGDVNTRSVRGPVYCRAGEAAPELLSVSTTPPHILRRVVDRFFFYFYSQGETVQALVSSFLSFLHRATVRVKHFPTRMYTPVWPATEDVPCQRGSAEAKGFTRRRLCLRSRRKGNNIMILPWSLHSPFN